MNRSLHLVHVRSDLNMVDAIRRPDGLAVVGVFLTVGHDGSSVASLSSALENVVHTVKAYTDILYRYWITATDIYIVTRFPRVGLETLCHAKFFKNLK
uniref:Alpha-carbonic anhydrase domain-containing protein n=1 Tax=Heterorhabditis bacteriophora TaxID=37862 RepID=A0A1I7X062_HETBA